MFRTQRKKRKTDVVKTENSQNPKKYHILEEKARIRVQRAATLEQFYSIAKKIKNLDSNKTGEIRVEKIEMYEEVIEEFLKLGFSVNKSIQDYGNCVYTIVFYDSEEAKRGIFKTYNEYGILCDTIAKFNCNLDVPYDTPGQQEKAFHANAYYYRKRSEKYKAMKREIFVETTLKLKEYVTGVINNFDNRKNGYFYLEEDEVNQDIIDLIWKAKLSISRYEMNDGKVRYKCSYLSNYNVSKQTQKEC